MPKTKPTNPVFTLVCGFFHILAEVLLSFCRFYFILFLSFPSPHISLIRHTPLLSHQYHNNTISVPPIASLPLIISLSPCAAIHPFNPINSDNSTHTNISQSFPLNSFVVISLYNKYLYNCYIYFIILYTTTHPYITVSLTNTLCKVYT